MKRIPNQWLEHGAERPFWSYTSTLLRAMRWRVGLALGLMISISLIEGVGLLLLVPLLQLVGLDTQQGSLGAIGRWVSSVFRSLGVRPTLSTVLVAYVLLVSAHGLLRRWQAHLSSALPQEFVAVLRVRLYRAMAHTNWLFFVRSRTSEFTHILTSEMERVVAATYHLLRLWASGIVAAVYVGFSLRLSPAMTGLALASAGGLGLLLRGKVRVSQVAGEGVSHAMRHLHIAISEHLGGMKVAKSYGAEDRHVKTFERLTRQAQDMYSSAIQNQAGVSYWFEVGSVAILSVILFLSIEVLAMPTTQVLLLVFLFARLLPRCSEMVQSYHRFVHCVPAFTSVMGVQKRCESAEEVPPHTVEELELRQAVQLQGVSFGYDGTAVVRDVDLTIRAGQTVALVGPSGAGKSTIADLIMGLLVPDKGRVLVDGIPLGPNTMKSWRDQVGYVNQDTFLFHDTIRANLRFARPEATEEEIARALELAAADEFVSKLPRGIDTVVGDRGMRLSGGERQRLALARALLRRPSLLILDEATSFLDAESEKRILETIEKLRGRMAVLIISHRLSAIQGADTIYVLQDGRVVESSGWGDLLA